MLPSSSQRMPARRVLPNAAIRAEAGGDSRIRRKNSASLGLEPGHPPSM